MKRIVHFAVALTVISTVGCSDRNNSELGNDATTMRTENAAGTSGAVADTAGSAEESREFVSEMAVSGQAEVQLGRMAAERASNPQVKQFGQMMVTDHTKAGEELKQAVASMNVTLPTALDEKHRDLSDRLSKLNGAEFDREYMKAMVDGHEEMLRKLESHSGTGGARTDAPRYDGDNNAAGNGAAAGHSPAGTTAGHAAETTMAAPSAASMTSPVAQWAAKGAPAVRQHLEQAKQIHDRLDER